MDPERFAMISMFGRAAQWPRCREDERRVLVGLTMSWRALGESWAMPWDGAYAHRHLTLVAVRAIIGAFLDDVSVPREVRTILAAALAGFPDPDVGGVDARAGLAAPLDGIRLAGERQLTIALAREGAASSPGR